MSPSSSRDIRVFPDFVTMSRAAADLVVSFAKEKTAPAGTFAVALSGGSTPKHLYTLLASSPCREAVPWRKVHVFWADERCVPGNRPESNYKPACDVFLSRVPVPDRNIHRIRGEEEPRKAALAYEGELRAFFGQNVLPAFDLVILGVGEDGHTASLFPGTAAAAEQKRLAVPVYLDPPDINRVTLTLPVLNNAAQVLFLAAGSSKARIVHEIIEDGNPRHSPAGRVRPVDGSLLWMLDQEAASALTEFASDL